MQPVPSTAEILAYLHLNRSLNGIAAEWATEMLIEGYDTEELGMLASESSLDYFKLRELMSIALTELQLDYSNKGRIIENYISYLCFKALSNKLSIELVLNTISEVVRELKFPEELMDFYYLACAKTELNQYGNQLYIPDIGVGEIDEFVKEHFKNWLKDHPIWYQNN